MPSADLSSDVSCLAADILRKSGLAVHGHDVARIYPEDFGLGEYRETGVGVLELVNTGALSIKILVLLPHQTCPEHRHRPVGDYAGKEETFRCQWGECYLHMPGPATTDPRAIPPAARRQSYTARHEIVLRPGDQHTSPPDTLHWFQAGAEGAVIWSLCSRAVVGADEFTDRDIVGPTRLGLGRQR